jgi:hypothetical protein
MSKIIFNSIANSQKMTFELQQQLRSPADENQNKIALKKLTQKHHLAICKESTCSSCQRNSFPGEIGSRMRQTL